MLQNRGFLRVSCVLATLCLASSLKAQFLLNSDSAFKAGSPNSGRIWGYAFGDYYYKTHSDSLKRGGANQYTGIPANRSAFQFRRIYLGYDYNISRKFSAELLLAAEDNFPAGNPVSSASPSGDLLQNNKLSFYIKLANIRWKNIWKGTDLVVGEVAPPTFPLLTEKIWGYRSVERTISDIRRLPSYDLGAELQGRFDAKGNFGYNLMVGNSNQAKPESDNFKTFYGDVYAYFLDRRLVFDLYADYQRLNWTSQFHHSRNMVKAFAAYTTPSLTVGVEAFINHGKQDVIGILGSQQDTLSADAEGISLYVHGDIQPGRLGYFARFDAYNPDVEYDAARYPKYTGLSSTYEPNSREQFITAGLDFTPAHNVHFMPNIWYTRYKSQQGLNNTDHDLVYRMTFYFIFGK
ncbi:MAG TPA: hypothetical protein VG870_02760 [Chitinophagaceae bacterium]|nr:hypothetical protein [Chitinophagaceae bacterium]